MIKLMGFFISQFTKVANATGLIRLKVFYQILIIIAVMIIIVGIQTYISVSIINTMQDKIQNIFIESSFRLNQLTRLKQDVIKLQTLYLEATINENTSVASIDQTLVERIMVFEWMNEENKKDIQEKIDSVKELLKSSPNKTNYELIKNELFELSLILNNVESELSSVTVKGITSNDRFLNESRMTGMILVIASSLFSIFIGLIIVNSISFPLKQMEKAAQAIAVGDLTQNIKTNGSPEILRVVNSLNKAIVGLQDLVKNINSQSEMLYNASQELKTTSSETGRSASEVAMAMEELAEGSTRQAEQISQATNTVHMLSEMVRKVTDDTGKIAFASENVAQATKVGMKATADVANEIHELYISTKEIDGVINELSKATDEIGEITSIISGIAEQTSLLALNAAIEAARAGEQGRGFAVVAQETGKLAEQSKQAAGLIGNLITNIRIRSEEAVKIMQKGMERAENGKNLTTQTSETLEAIFKSLTDNLVQIESVAQSARNMADSNKVVIESINEIATISEESLASTEEVSATAQEQSALTQQVVALSDSLNQIANSLHQAVAVFELEQMN